MLPLFINTDLLKSISKAKLIVDYLANVVNFGIFI